MDKLLVENLLQILHGVRIQLNNDDFDFILPIAYSLNLHNVIRYCDQQMIEYSCISPIELSSFEFLEEVVDYGLRRSLVQLVKRFEESFEVIDVAWRFNFSNVIRYCEFKIIERIEKFNIIDFREAFFFEMRHCLKRYMEYVDSVEMVAHLLKDIEETMGMEQMSSESMKTFVEKFMTF
ncbi:hypothetical protein CAEBREN_20665 [Caenorhabditis brenneri]|uniref:Uncharacterized protein n=1 Tax=Caenorhabditis brenneri TaxID=135651 RepID=G0NIV8_CAEBE|nr:hypothetical protein CAEBREN_20665 [Caenorhabditis brenneri]